MDPTITIEGVEYKATERGVEYTLSDWVSTGDDEIGVHLTGEIPWAKVAELAAWLETAHA